MCEIILFMCHVLRKRVKNIASVSSILHAEIVFYIICLQPISSNSIDFGLAVGNYATTPRIEQDGK